MQARDFAIPLCSTWHLHTASDSGVEGKKKVLGDEEEATKNWAYTEGGLWRIQQMGAKKKCQWVVKLNSLHGYFSNLVIFLPEIL